MPRLFDIPEHEVLRGYLIAHFQPRFGFFIRADA